MALDGHELTVSVQQSYPSAGAVTSPVGGSWPGGTYSFKVAAVYWTKDALEIDHGVIRINVPAWAGHVVAANDKVTITWTASERPPDHYSIYYIENATWAADGTLRGRKIAEVNGDILTATILKPFLHQGASTNVTSTTTGGNHATILIDATATFETDGVKAGDWLSNVTDASTAAVVSVDSEIKLTTTVLTGGGDNTWQTGDTYRVTSTTLLKDTAATFVTNGVSVGDYVILNVSGEYAKITAVVSETVLTTEALTGSDLYNLGDTYDVVYHVMIYDADARSFVINPIKDVNLEVRKTMTRSYLGRLVSKSYALGSPLDAIEIEIYNSSITMANYHFIQLYLYHGTRCRITESSGADALITPMDGYFTDCSFLGSKHKNSRPVHRIRYECELGTAT